MPREEALPLARGARAVVVAPSLPQLWSVAEVCERLKLPRTTLLLHIARGNLPARRIGKHIRIAERDLVAWWEALPSAANPKEWSSRER